MTFHGLLLFLLMFLPSVAGTAKLSAARPAQQTNDPQADVSQPVPAQAGSAYKLPPEKLAKAIAINRIRDILDIVYEFWSVAFIWILLATRAAVRLENWAEAVFKRRWMQGLLFFAALIVLIDLSSLPIALYGHSVSLGYGISVQGWAGWLGDQAKALALSVLVGAPALLLFNWIVRRWPRRYWLGAWVATLPLLVLSIFVAPLVEPLFNHYEPLSKNHAELVAKLEGVVARTGTNIPPDRMFLMKASEKTNGPNAYVTGLGATKRIVVWDTTAGRIPDDEIMFIFGHESGHYVLHHIPKTLAGASFGLFFVYWACAGFAAVLARRFGSRWGLRQGNAVLATRAGFVVLIFAVAVAGFVLEPAANAFSRHFEHEADIYGQEAIHGLVPDPQKTAVASFNALGEAWLDDPNPNPFIEFWEYNHPSIKNRADFAAHYDPWANGGRGKFFAK